MTFSFPAGSLLTALLLMFISEAAQPAAANMASPIQAGGTLGEPFGDLRGIVIERENLTIDMRPLLRNDDALIEAVYHLRNSGEEQILELAFVAGALWTERPDTMWRVLVDGNPVPCRVTDSMPLPGSWLMPENTPAPEGKTLIYEARIPMTILFSARLAPGRHTIAVRYRAMPTEHSADSPVSYHQLGYVLAPAREWGGFGTLNAVVLLPEGWWGACEPSMNHAGDSLTATWEGIPADALALTVQAPLPDYYGVMGIAPQMATALLGLVLAIVIGRSAGRRLARKGQSIYVGLLPAFLTGCLAFLIMMGGIVVSVALQDNALGGQEAWTYSYLKPVGYGFTYLPLAFFLGTAVTQISAVLAARREKGKRTIAEVEESNRTQMES